MFAFAISIVALGSPLAPPARGGFDQTRLPADVRWAVHLDLGAMRASELGAELLRALEAHAADDGDLAKLEREIGMNPLADVQSVTLHGAQGEEDAVVQVRMSAKADELLARARAETSVRPMQVGATRLLAIGDPGSEIFVSIEPEGADRVIVLADDPDRVARTVDVLHGRAPSLQQSASPAFSRGPGAGAWLYVASRAPLSEITDFEPASRVAELVHGGVFELGEREQRLYASLEVDARTTEDAERIASILQGGIALLELAMLDEEVPDVARNLLQRLSVDRLGSGVRFALEIPATEVRELLHEVKEMEDR